MIKKAVLPVAGFGTRFLPASKAIPKEMLPIIDKPLVQYAVEEAVNAGIDEIIFITSPEKVSIEKHFSKNEILENTLKKNNKDQFIDLLNPPIFEKITFHYVLQEQQKGLGDAILCAEEIVGDDPFAVLLPDELFISEESCLQKLINEFNKNLKSVIAVNYIDKKNIHKYGVIDPIFYENEQIQIKSIVEKPSAEDAPSDLAVCGRYIFKSSIFKYLKKTTADLSQEVQLTDAIQEMLASSDVFAKIYDGLKFDCGSKSGFVEATLYLAMQDKDLKEKISISKETDS